jgi:hypothetical protein
VSSNIKVRCVTDADKGMIFIEPDGRVRAYRLEELAPNGDDEELLHALELRVFRRYPEYREAFERVELGDVFCKTCGYWAFDVEEGDVACAECGDQMLHSPGQMVAIGLMGRRKEESWRRKKGRSTSPRSRRPSD